MLWKFLFCYCRKTLSTNLFFLWGHEQYLMTLSQFIVGNYYCLKDLNHVYSACQGLPYGKEDQTLLIDDERTKLFEIPRKVFFYKSVIEDISCPRIRCNGWTSLRGCGQRWLDYFLQVQFKCILDYHQVF